MSRFSNIVLFGLMTCLAGVIIVVDPEIIFGFLRDNVERLSLHVTAVATRAVLGILLVLSSDASRFPAV